jgi:hypothetical protein
MHSVSRQQQVLPSQLLPLVRLALLCLEEEELQPTLDCLVAPQLLRLDSQHSRQQLASLVIFIYVVLCIETFILIIIIILGFNTGTSAPLFGSTTGVSSFAQPKPAFGGFGTNTSTSNLFGAQPTVSGTTAGQPGTLFNQTPSLFGTGIYLLCIFKILLNFTTCILEMQCVLCNLLTCSCIQRVNKFNFTFLLKFFLL